MILRENKHLIVEKIDNNYYVYIRDGSQVGVWWEGPIITKDSFKSGLSQHVFYPLADSKKNFTFSVNEYVVGRDFDTEVNKMIEKEERSIYYIDGTTRIEGI